jgi:H/ACA ribonucleoprotein complex subunit 4
MFMGLLPFEKMKRTILVRQEAQTSNSFGRDPYLQPVSDLLNCGVVNIDKPSGPTSHQVSSFVQNILGINKSGHSGTLDPKVTGVLPTALGKGTRIVQSLLTAGKEYVCLMHSNDSDGHHNQAVRFRLSLPAPSD